MFLQGCLFMLLKKLNEQFWVNNHYLSGIQPYRSCHHSYSHDIEDDERDIIHKEDSNLEEIKVSSFTIIYSDIITCYVCHSSVYTFFINLVNVKLLQCGTVITSFTLCSWYEWELFCCGSMLLGHNYFTPTTKMNDSRATHSVHFILHVFNTKN